MWNSFEASREFTCQNHISGGAIASLAFGYLRVAHGVEGLFAGIVNLVVSARPLIPQRPWYPVSLVPVDFFILLTVAPC